MIDMNTDMMTVRAGWSLIDDWQTRGLLDGVVTTRTTVTATAAIIDGLAYDCELQIGPGMEPSPGFRRVCIAFINRACVALRDRQVD